MGLLNWLKKRKAPPTLAAPELEASAPLAFVLLSEPQLPELSDLQIDFHQFAPAGQTITETIEAESPAREYGDEHLALRIEGIGTAYLMLMRFSVPNGEAEGARDFSIGTYRDRDFNHQSHHAHIMVTFFPEDGLSPIRIMTSFTALLAAIAKSLPCTEIYWGNSGATHTRDIFLSLAEAGKEDLGPLIMLWNGLSRAMEDDGLISFLSLGMHQLGLPNLYLITVKEKYGDAFEWIWDLLGYAASRGEPIPAGDTIGVSEDHQLVVEYAPTPTGENDIVWKIEM